MNWQHFRAILWLRWRLGANQLKRAGIVNTVIMAILAAGVIVLSMILFVTFFSVGRFALASASPAIVMYVWDGLVAAMLFFWVIGLMSELQRSEAVSLTKFLHLPVSLTGAFVINYLSSLVSVTLVLFLPAMVGLSLGLVFAKGPAMLWLLPLLAAFLLMVTAITYQFQSWLASLMVNKRRRRTIIFLITMAFVLIFQLPNLLNILRPARQAEPISRLAQEQAELDREFSSGAISAEQYRQRRQELAQESQASRRGRMEHVEQTARLVNLVLPPGWLPFGALALAEGKLLEPLLATLALSLLGAASLWRSYRTTVRLYTGQFTSGKKKPAALAPPTKGKIRGPGLLEKQLPWLSEHASAIALAGFRSLLRAPEAKMMLLSPIILVVIFGAMFLRRPLNPNPAVPGGPTGRQPEVALSEALRPLVPFGAMAMVLLSMGQILGNQFGFDRSGFRVFVLSPARRRDILLGKNLAVAPLALGLCLGVVVIMQVIRPMRFDHFLAALPQLLSMYLLFCLLSNGLSILAPMPIASGSIRPTNFKTIPMLLHFAFVLLVFPLAVGPALLPLIIELVLQEFTGTKEIPIALILSLLESAGVVFLYLFVVDGEGRWLQSREKKILEVVAAKAE
jgi:hypothetical protein